MLIYILFCPILYILINFVLIFRFWYKIKYTNFNVNAYPSYLDGTSFIRIWPRGVYFVLVDNEKDVDELKASLNEHINNKDHSGNVIWSQTTGIIQIEKSCGTKSIDDIIRDNYYLPSWYDVTKRMNAQDRYLIFFNDIDNWSKNKFHLSHFFNGIAHHSYDRGAIYSIVVIRNKEIYNELLKINDGAKICGFNRNKLLTEEQQEIYRELTRRNSSIQ